MSIAILACCTQLFMLTQTQLEHCNIYSSYKSHQLTYSMLKTGVVTDGNRLLLFVINILY